VLLSSRGLNRAFHYRFPAGTSGALRSVADKSISLANSDTERKVGIAPVFLGSNLERICLNPGAFIDNNPARLEKLTSGPLVFAWFNFRVARNGGNGQKVKMRDNLSILCDW
jgi:hypothetical protein